MDRSFFYSCSFIIANWENAVSNSPLALLEDIVTLTLWWLSAFSGSADLVTIVDIPGKNEKEKRWTWRRSVLEISKQRSMDNEKIGKS
jgi:hypothetical protein